MGSLKKPPTSQSSHISTPPVTVSPHPTTGKLDASELEVVLEVDGGVSPAIGEMGPADNSKIRRESSIEFWRVDGAESSHSGRHPEVEVAAAEDPPSQLIGRFLHSQFASGCDVSLDMDLEMEELRSWLAPVPESPAATPQPNASKEIRVSFDRADQTPRRRQRNSPGNDRTDDDVRCSSDVQEDVLKCSSNSSFFRRQPTLMRAKTRSRLMDPPEEPDLRSGRVARSSQLRSGGRTGRAMGEDNEEDDLLHDEYLPDEYKKAKLSLVTLLEWVSLFSIIAALVGTLMIPKFRDRDIWRLKLWKWEVMVLVLICGRLVSGWVIRILVFFVERNFMLRKQVLYFVYGVRKAVQNCLWLGLVLIAWHAIFDKKVQRETNTKSLEYVTKVLVCLLVGTLLWLVKTLIIKVLASSFHVSTYFDRIQESLFNQYVIETLSGPPIIEIQRAEDEDRLQEEVRALQETGVALPPGLKPAVSPMKSGKVIGSVRLGQRSPQGKNLRLSRELLEKDNERISIHHLHRLNPRNVSAWKMKRLINMIRHGVISTLDEQIPNSTTEDDSASLIRTENDAKAAARKIYKNVAKPGSKYIYLEDLMRFMQEDEALKTLCLFEGAAESKKIDKCDLKNWLVNAFRERRALALTLNDTETAVHKLHRVINAIIGIIILIIWLLIMGIATTKFLVFMSSQLVLVAFIFGNTCKTVFEAIIFLFVMHPFDVGDRVEVDGVQLVVEEMNILTTVFLRYDNQKIVFPNSTLSTKAIGNYYRSPDMGDGVEFSVHVSTPAEKIAALKQRITSYIDGKKEHWYSSPMIIMKDLEDLNRVRIAVWLCHRINHQNMGEKWARRALLLEEMVKIFKELDIQYRLYPLDINVRALPPVSSTQLPPGWTAESS